MDYKDFALQKESEHLYFWNKAKNNLIENLLFSIYKNYWSVSNRKILDIGCGTGTELEILEKFGNITAIDISKESIELVKKMGHKTILANIENSNFKKNYYDAICCFDILEHLENDQNVLKKIHYSLKDGGHLFITVPAYQLLYSTHDIAMGHKRRYNKKAVITRLKNASFEIILINYWNFFLFFPIVLMRLMKKIFFLKIYRKKNLRPESKPLNKYLNNLLFLILNFENKLLNINNKIIPFGLTICGIAKKINYSEKSHNYY